MRFDLDAGRHVFVVMLKANCDPDLSSLFGWNTKQIFVWIQASYPSDSPATIPPSQAVIWDAVIPAINAPWHENTYIHPVDRKGSKPKSKAKNKQKQGLPYPAGTAPGILRLAGQKPKYQITDASGLMADRTNATLSLHWNVQPWVGALVWTNWQTIGRWQGLEGGVTEAFDFPPLKGTEVKKEDLRTETGAEARKGSPR